MKNKVMSGLVLSLFLVASLFTTLIGEYDSISMIKQVETNAAVTVQSASMTVEAVENSDMPANSNSFAKTEELNPATIPCRRAVLLDAESGRLLYGKNENEVVEMASTTKIMTAILALERGNLQDVVTVSKEAAATEGSNISLRAGEKLTLEELLYGLMLNSGNDAAVAIAEHIGGSVEGFADMMTHRARQLGLRHTSFKTPHGLDREGHHTTALELALLTRHAMQHPKFNEIVSTRTANITGRSLHNTNELLAYYPGADGVKTGYTGLAGRCLVASATQNGLRLISVALGADSRTYRAKSCSMLLDYGFKNFKPYKVVDMNKNPKSILVAKGKSDTVNTSMVNVYNIVKGMEENTISIPISRGEKSKVKVEFCIPEVVAAPVIANTEIGDVKVFVGDQLVSSRKIKSIDSVAEKRYSDYFLDLCRGFVTIIS